MSTHSRLPWSHLSIIHSTFHTVEQELLFHLETLTEQSSAAMLTIVGGWLSAHFTSAAIASLEVCHCSRSLSTRFTKNR